MKTFCRAVFLFLGLALPAAARPSGAAPSPHYPPNPNVQVTITCADMRRDPVGVFSRPIDLGSSVYTPTDLYFECEEIANRIGVLGAIEAMEARRRQVGDGAAIELALHPGDQRAESSRIRPPHAGGRHHAGA